MAKRERCPTCGKLMFRTGCKACQQARMARARAEAVKAINENRCPKCGQGVQANSAILGWVQCDGYGADGFRRNNATPCNWQGFTQ